MKYIFGISALLFICFNGICQPAAPFKCYHQQTQSCRVVYNTITDFTLELFADSTIRIAEYTRSSADQNNTITRNLYNGIYSITGDTLTITWLNKNFTSKQKGQRFRYANHIYPKNPAEHFPCNRFIIMKRYLAPVGNSYPSLEKVGHYAIRLIESSFDQASDVSQSSR